MIARRQLLASALLPAIAGAARPEGVLVETHVHLYASDLTRFPIAPGANRPRPKSVEDYVKFSAEARLDHAVIVHPEPYQDDHSYLEYCLTQGPSKNFFKGTCLFDPIDPKTPKRLEELVRRNPGRIVALRVHEVRPAGTPPTKGGTIRDRDLADPQMAVAWRAAHELGLAIQLHCIPHHAPEIGKLAAKFPKMPVLLDHLARPGQGTPREYKEVLRLADLPNVHIKFTGTAFAARPREGQAPPDVQPLAKKVYGAFGPERLLWGEIGDSMAALEKAAGLFNVAFEFAPERDKARIRGANARRLFGF